MSEQKCATCRFFKPHKEPHDEPQGNCRRYPPVLDVVFLRYQVEAIVSRMPAVEQDDARCDESHQQAIESYSWVLPVVEDEDWCGEYQPTLSEAAQ